MKTFFLIFDTSLRARSGSRIWGVAKRRANQYGRWLNNAHQIVALIGYAGGVRLPIDCRLHLKAKILPRGAPYKSTNQLATEILEAFGPPPCRRVVVLADAAFASNQLLKAIRSRRWHFLFAMATTRRLVSAKSSEDMARYTPHKHYRTLFVPLPNSRKRAFWIIGRKHAIGVTGRLKTGQRWLLQNQPVCVW